MSPGLASRPHARGRQSGYTLVEIIVAMTVLAVGSAVLWYTLRASARLELMNRLHHEANILARSELESLRSVLKQDIRDTSYRVPGPGGVELMVVREAMDSARIVATLEEVVLDERMSPAELRKPLEVRVRVFMRGEGGDREESGPMPDWDPDGEGEDGSRRTLASLSIKIPEYRRH